MTYLFEAKMNNLMAKSDKAELKKFNLKCEDLTAHLLLNYSRGNLQYLVDDATADALVISMGSKSRRDRGKVPAAAPHAIDYVSNWVEVSNNCQHIVGLVDAEKAKAYEIGLDIRNPEVIGKIYKLAVGYYSFADYIGFAQNEPRR